MEKQIQVWDEDSVEMLKGCLECTSWTILEDTSSDLHEQTEAISSYIDFCVSAVIPTKTIKVYPNNKPWVTKELKDILNEKKRVFASGSLQNRKDMQRKVNKEIYKARCQYRDRVQNTLAAGNSRAAWTGIKQMANAPFKTAKRINFMDDIASLALANNLN